MPTRYDQLIDQETLNKIMDELNQNSVIKDSSKKKAIAKAIEAGLFSEAQYLINEAFRGGAADAPSLDSILHKQGYDDENARIAYDVLRDKEPTFPLWRFSDSKPPTPSDFLTQENWSTAQMKHDIPLKQWGSLHLKQFPPEPAYRSERLFPKGLTDQASTADAVRHALGQTLTRTPPVYQGQTVAPLGEAHANSKTLANSLAKQASDNYLEDPSRDVFRAQINSGMQANDLAPFEEGMKGVSTSELLKIVGERGLTNNYVQEAMEQAGRIFDDEIRPKISSRFAGEGRAFDSSARLAAIESYRRKYLEDARMKAREEDRHLKQSELAEAYKQLLGGREQAMAASSNKQGAMNEAATRQQSGSEALLNNQKQHFATQMAADIRRQDLGALEQNREQKLLNQDIQKFNTAQNWTNDQLHRVGAANQGMQIAPPAPIVYPVPPAPDIAGNNGAMVAQLLGYNPHQPQTVAQGGLVRGYAQGGQVHLPPEYSEKQLGMQDYEVIRQRQLAEELAARQGNPERGYWSNMAGMFSEHGPAAIARASAAAHKAMSEEEDKPYAGKLAAAAAMDRIHQSRQDQKRALMDYHRLTDKELWDRAHKSKELALETEKVRALLEAKQKPKLGDKEKISQAMASDSGYDAMLKDLDEYDQLLSEDPKIGGGVLSKFISSPSILSGTGYADSDTLEKVKNLDDKINMNLQLVLDTDKTLDKETRKAAKELMSLSNTGISHDDLKKKVNLLKDFIGRKKMVTSGTLGDPLPTRSPGLAEKKTSQRGMSLDDVDSRIEALQAKMDAAQASR
jgi:hypothetical protein